MPAKRITIAEALKDALNDAPWQLSISQSFTAERQYSRVRSLEDLATLRVDVVPRTQEGTVLNRGRDREVRYLVDVAVHQRTDGDAAANDALMLLVENIVDRLWELKTMSGLPLLEVTEPTGWNTDAMHDSDVFFNVSTFTYRAERETP